MVANLDSLMSVLRRALPSLRERYGVNQIWVFGSFASGSAKESSDIDVLVEFKGNGMTMIRFIELEQELTGLLGIKVDLVTRSALKESMRESILSEAVAV